MKKILALLLIIASIALFPATGCAAPINNSGAERLKQQIEEELLWRTNLAKLGGQGITAEGPIEVTPRDSFYQVKVTGVSLLMGPDRWLNIGTVAANVSEGTAGEWRASITIPSSITLYDKGNTAKGLITIGSQSVAISWFPAQGIYPKANSLYQNVKIQTQDKEIFTGTIGRLQISSDLHNNGDGTWSGPAGFEATGIKAETSGKAATEVTIGKVTLTTKYDKLDLAKSIENRKMIMESTLSGKTLQAKDVSKILSDAKQMVDSVNSALSISNVRIREKYAAGASAPVDVTFDSFSSQGSLSNAQQEKASAEFKAALTGLKASQVPAELSGLVPHDVNLEATVNNIPFSKVMAMLLETLQKPQEQQANTPLVPLQELLQKSGMAVSIQNSFIKSRDVEAGLAGRINWDTTAAAGMVGKITLSVKGLETAISQLQTMASGPGASAQLVGYAGGLTAMMLMGQSDKTVNGEKVSNYVFEITPDGKLLINGMNLMTAVNAGAILNQHVNHENPVIKKVSPE